MRLCSVSDLTKVMEPGRALHSDSGVRALNHRTTHPSVRTGIPVPGV